jgi:hypothetical protein
MEDEIFQFKLKSRKIKRKTNNLLNLNEKFQNLV